MKYNDRKPCRAGTSVGPYRVAVLVAGLVLSSASSAQADFEIESFTGGDFTNPFFIHDIEFDCCWAIEFEGGRWVLHFEPNTDLITFDLPEGQRVQSISVEIEDFEGGFVGDDPTSVAVVRAASGDFALLRAAEIGVREVARADVNTPGRLTGEPLGEIVSIHFQAANEGNNVIPERAGANFDDLTVELVPVGPGVPAIVAPAILPMSVAVLAIGGLMLRRRSLQPTHS